MTTRFEVRLDDGFTIRINADDAAEAIRKAESQPTAKGSKAVSVSKCGEIGDTGNNSLSIEELTSRFYAVKEQRDRFLGFCRNVLPETPHSGGLWDHEIGTMFRQLLDNDRKKLKDLLDKAASYCPVAIQDEIRAAIAKPNAPEHPARLIEALKAIADPEHCLTKFTVGGLRDIAASALQEIDPANDYSECVGVSPHLVCPSCGKVGEFVNQCGCDPNNMPTEIPAGHYFKDDLDGGRLIQKDGK